jgi:hypothetical protein
MKQFLVLSVEQNTEQPLCFAPPLMQPENHDVLEPEDPSLVPDPKKQSVYQSMVARLQYAATWVHFDISFTVAQLLVARLCASAGPTHWAALHHVIEYLAKHSSLKFGCRKITSTPKGLDGFCANADWVNSSSS